MKKKLAVIAIAAAMSLSIVACGGSSSSSSQPASSTQTEASSSEESSSSTTSSSSAASSSSEATATYATLDAYNQVKEGMTLDEVNQIFGFEGTKSASGSASVAGMSSTAEVYTWAGEAAGSSASIGFQDGEVVSMAQAGLK